MTEMVEIMDFFGAPVCNTLLGRIFYTYKPEWLRGKPRLNMLPRYTEETKVAEWVSVSSPETTALDISDKIVFVVENLEGGWFLGPKGFGFEIETDAILFKALG